MMKRIGLWTAVPFLCLGLATTALGSGGQNVQFENRILTILNAYEYQPSLKIWKEMGLKQVNKTLAEIALAANADPRMRSRAALALGDIPSNRTHVTLRALISDKRAHLGLRRQALLSIARAFPVRSYDQVRAQLLSGPKHMREAAALAMTYLRDVRVDALLSERLATESEFLVRTAIERAMKMRANLRAKRGFDAPNSPQIAPLTPAQRDAL